VSFPLLMFISRVGAHRGTVAMLFGMFLLTGVVLMQMGMREGELRIDGYRYLPTLEDDSAGMLDPEHYADQRRSGETLAPRPYIPSEIVRGDYLRLFIPYRPSRDNPEIERRCPALTAGNLDRNAAESETLVLGCLAQIYTIRIDGVVQPNADFVFAQDAVGGQRGVVSMLPMTTLDRGRHELRIERSPRPDEAPDAPPPAPYRIAFWR
jgi:hypothetical protein